MATLLLTFGVISVTQILELNGDRVVSLEVFDNYKDPGIKIFMSSKKLKDVTIVSNVNNKKLGKYKINYFYKGKRITRKVLVIDKTSPRIKLKGDNPNYVCSFKDYQELGYEAIDNYDGDITSKVVVHTIDHNKIYEVFDSSNNKTKVIRTIEEKDIEKPIITLTNGNNISMSLNTEYKDNYTAMDNCDGDITTKVKTTGVVDTSKVGSYTINYEVVDSSGNISKAIRTVNVKQIYNGAVIYLTYDDGPSNSVTPYVLDILKKYNVKATFFVVNHDSSTNYLIKRASEEGHTIGLHSYNHNYNIYTGVDTYFSDLMAIENKVIDLIGGSSKIIRFPGGSSNTVSKNYNIGIMTILALEVQNRGYKYVDWNVGSSDTVTNDSDVVCNNVKSRLGSGTNVVLMHDYDGKTSSIAATECIIKYGIERGYDFSNITLDTKNIHHRIAN